MRPPQKDTFWTRERKQGRLNKTLGWQTTPVGDSVRRDTLQPHQPTMVIVLPEASAGVGRLSWTPAAPVGQAPRTETWRENLKARQGASAKSVSSPEQAKEEASTEKASPTQSAKMMSRRNSPRDGNDGERRNSPQPPPSPPVFPESVELGRSGWTSMTLPGHVAKDRVTDVGALSTGGAGGGGGGGWHVPAAPATMPARKAARWETPSERYGRGDPAQVAATIGSGAPELLQDVEGEGEVPAGIYFGSEEKQRPVLGVREQALEGGWAGEKQKIGRFDSKVSIESYESYDEAEDDYDTDLQGHGSTLDSFAHGHGSTLGSLTMGSTNTSFVQRAAAAPGASGAAAEEEGGMSKEEAEDKAKKERARRRRAKKAARKGQRADMARTASWKQSYYEADKKKGLMSTLSRKTLLIGGDFDSDSTAPGQGGMMESLKRGMSMKMVDRQAPATKDIAVDPGMPALHWTRDRDVLDGMVHAYAWRVATTGVLGFVCCIVQNELIIMSYPPDHRLVEIFKALCTCLTLLCLVLLYRYYYIYVLFQRLKRHISRGIHFNTEVKARDVLRLRGFWIEVAVCAIHLPPFSTFELEIATMKSRLMIRAETIGCLWTSFRLYLLWRVYRNFVVRKLPMRHTVSRFTLLTFGSYFVFKKVLSGWQAVFWMSRLWLGLMLVSGYWYRCVELNACLFDTSSTSLCDYTEEELEGVLVERDGRTQPLLSNDVYYQNAIWQMFTASTTVGYGDTTPRTHLGRAIACLFAISGIIITALLTAGLTNALAWTSEEKSALNLCYREKSRAQLIVQAARILQMWWRRCLAKKQGLSQQEVDELTPESHWQVKKEFSVSRREVLVEIDDLAGEGLKIDLVYKRTKTTIDLLDAMADYLWDPERQMQRIAASDRGGDELGTEKPDENAKRDSDCRTNWKTSKGSIKSVFGGLPEGMNKLPKNRKEKETCNAKRLTNDIVHSIQFKDALKATVARLSKIQGALMNPALLQANKALQDHRKGFAGLTKNLMMRDEAGRRGSQKGFPESPNARIGSTNLADLDSLWGKKESVHRTSSVEAGIKTSGSDAFASRLPSHPAAPTLSSGTLGPLHKAGTLKDVTKSIASARIPSPTNNDMIPGPEVMPYVPAWWRRREMIDERLMTISAVTCAFGLVGNLLAVTQNELIMGGIPANSSGINLLKAGNMVCAVAMCALLLRYYWIAALFRSLSNHLDYCVALGDVSVHEAFSSPYLWIEIFVCTIHLPPFVTFQIHLDSLGNVVLYQAETLFCIVNTFRFYLVWKVVRDWVLKDLPKRHTVSRYTAVHFGDIFALKKLLNGGSGVIPVASFWFLGVILSGYWYRSLELTACLFPPMTEGMYYDALKDVSLFQVDTVPEPHPACLEQRALTWVIYGISFEVKNDVYLWNAFWVMFVTTTTVGYGDYTPVTDLGRLVAAVGAMTGIVLAAILTAALCNGVQWTAEEAAAVHLFEREEARRALGPAAASLIGLWWRRKRRKTVSSEFLARVLAARMKFHSIKKAAMVEMEDCVDHSTRVDQLAKQAKYVETACTYIKARVTDADPTFEFSVDTSLVSLAQPIILDSSMKAAKQESSSIEASMHGDVAGHESSSLTSLSGRRLSDKTMPPKLRSQNSFVRGVVSRKQRRDTNIGLVGSPGGAPDGAGFLQSSSFAGSGSLLSLGGRDSSMKKGNLNF